MFWMPHQIKFLTFLNLSFSFCFQLKFLRARCCLFLLWQWGFEIIRHKPSVASEISHSRFLCSFIVLGACRFLSSASTSCREPFWYDTNYSPLVPLQLCWNASVVFGVQREKLNLVSFVKAVISGCFSCSSHNKLLCWFEFAWTIWSQGIESEIKAAGGGKRTWPG